MFSDLLVFVDVMPRSFLVLLAVGWLAILSSSYLTSLIASF